jgi:hypothetical protein
MHVVLSSTVSLVLYPTCLGIVAVLVLYTAVDMVVISVSQKVVRCCGRYKRF